MSPSGEQQVVAAPPWPDIWVSWWQPLAEPVRVRQALPVREQHVLELPPQPVPVPGGGGGWDLPRPDVERLRHRLRKGVRQVEPARRPPSFREFLETWKPPPLVIVDDLVRKPVPSPVRPLPPVEVRYPEALTRIAAQLDDAEDMQAIAAALDALPDERIEMLHLLARLTRRDA